MTDAIATIAHIRAAGLCARGARAWAARHGFDWSAFLRDGVSVARLEALDDPFAARVIAEVRRGR
ncbi:MAG: hypothetical protein JSR26_03850 [Proteobacteria bacterium]|nr:hypothetical protein [Pseudomonadota bacterium]